MHTGDKSDKRSTTALKYRHLYKRRAWKDTRLTILARDLYTCQNCHTPLTPGRQRDTDAVVHHRTPHKGSIAMFFDPDNLEAVCKKCHDSAIQSQERSNAPTIGADGWPT